MREEIGIDPPSHKSFGGAGELGKDGDIWGWFRDNPKTAILGGVGVVLLVAGAVTVTGSLQGHQGRVEIISGDEAMSTGSAQIMVDVAGAVENPGVYSLAKDGRVNDALTAAGGLAQSADRNWVYRFINLAQRIPDGAKIYVPTMGESHSNDQLSNNQFSINDDGGKVSGAATIGLGSEQSGTTNINTAGKNQLEELWGIGAARAEAIINNRPYNSIEELLTKAGIPKNVYDRIKLQVSVY